jgi:hypothetical protein
VNSPGRRALAASVWPRTIPLTIADQPSDVRFYYQLFAFQRQG